MAHLRASPSPGIGTAVRTPAVPSGPPTDRSPHGQMRRGGPSGLHPFDCTPYRPRRGLALGCRRWQGTPKRKPNLRTVRMIRHRTSRPGCRASMECYISSILPRFILPRRGRKTSSSTGLRGRGPLGLDECCPFLGNAGADGRPPARWAEMRSRPSRALRRWKEICRACCVPSTADPVSSGDRPRRQLQGPSVLAARPSGLRSRDEPSRQWGRDAPSTTRPSLQSGASVPAPE